MSKKHIRKKVFVDRKVQGAIAARAGRYWITSISVVGMLTVVGWVFVTPGIGALASAPDTLRSVFCCLAVAVIVSCLMMPVVLYDLVRFSHRFAGPMVRLRNSMQRSAAGEQVAPIRFRDDDFWQELADAFNAMQQRIDQLEIDAAESPQVEEELVCN